MANTTLVKRFGPQYLDWLVKGYIHNANTLQAGLELLYPATTSGHIALWNPQGSKKMMIPLKIKLGATTVTTVTNATPAICYVAGAGSVPATGAPILTWTELNGTIPVKTANYLVNGRLGLAVNSDIKYSVVNTFTAVPVVHTYLGYGTDAWVVTATYPSFLMEHIFDGEMCIEPGSAAMLTGGVASTGTKYGVSWTFAMVPMAELGL